MAQAPDPKAPAADKPVKIMLLCDHVHLPEDLLRDDWATTSDATRRYEGKEGKTRTRLEVHATLAAFLQEREQAEVI